LHFNSLLFFSITALACALLLSKIEAIKTSKAYRLINQIPTTLITTAINGKRNIMDVT
jgi:hypothetical protein